MEYKINIPRIQGIESYEQNNENVASIIVQDKDGHNITKTCKVELYISRTAMLELGKELIRDTYRKNGGDVFHFYRAGTGLGINETLGVILHPISVEPIIIDGVGKPIETYLEDSTHDL